MSNGSTGLTLEELNAEESRYYLGGTILVAVLAAIGIVGNVHVLLVYTLRMKQSNHRVFIICLGILDLITCVVGMPFIIINFVKPFTFNESMICKILTFYNFFICLSSACVLIVIAVDRYRKICKPHSKQMSQRVAKAMCLAAMGLALLFSWPALVMYGSTPAPTRDPYIEGRECNVLVEVRETYYPILFNGILLVIAFCSFIVLSVLYGIIGSVIWNHRTFKNKSDEVNTEITAVKSTTDHGFKSVTFHSGSSDSNENSHGQSQETIIEDAEVNGSDTDHKYAPKLSPRRSSVQTKIEMRKRSKKAEESKDNRTSLQRAMSKFDRTKRTTVMLFWITIFFFLSYVPYLVLRIIYYTNTEWYPSMTFAGKVTYNTFLWCVYINNMANSIIYGFCDQRFRQEVKRGYERLCCRS